MIETLATDSLMKVASALPNIFASMQSGSLIEYTRPTRIEPLVLVDMGLEGKPLSDIMQTLTNVFSAYYLQAIALSNTIGSVTVLRRLDKFQPRRSFKDNAVQTLAGVGQQMGSVECLSLEQYSKKLPTYSLNPTPYHHASLEAAYVAPAKVVTANTDSLNMLRNVDSLATGKTMSVEIVDNGRTVSIPVTVKLSPVAIGSDIFVSCFSEGGFKNNYKERLWRFSTGELSAIGDMIFCNDLIDAHKKNLKADKSGIYKEVMARKRGNKLSAAITASPSVATASNIAIISDMTALKWGREIGSPIDNFSQRERIFEASSLMMLVVYDTNWDRITLYYKSIKLPTELSLSDMKTLNKNSSPDILEMIRAFTGSGKTGSGPIL